LHPGELRVQTYVQAVDGAAIDQTGFAWTVLGALASELSIESGADQLGITITKRREAALS
jgi:hypothetical protein